jgi:hypothetical protein
MPIKATVALLIIVSPVSTTAAEKLLQNVEMSRTCRVNDIKGNSFMFQFCWPQGEQQNLNEEGN